MENSTVVAFEENPATKIIVGISMLFLLVGVLCAGLIPYWITPVVKSDTILTNGLISGFVTDSYDPSMKSEIFTFQTKEGDKVNVTSGISSNVISHHVDDQVAVYYNPSEPQKAWLKDDDGLNLILLILRILGGAFAVIGLLLLAFKDKIKNKGFYISRTIGNGNFNSMN